MKYKGMEVESITKENLSKIAEQIGDDSLLAHDDICFEHSMYSMNENGEITAVIILRRNSLYDYFGGEIPADINFEEDEYHIREDLHKLHPDGNEHYEMICYYLKDKEYHYHLRNLYNLVAYHDGLLIGAIWTKYNEEKVFPLRGAMYNFNNIIWIDLDIED